MFALFSTHRFQIGLFLCVLASGFSGIIAELNLFNIAHLLVGGTNRILAYTMGVMMFFMGIGSLSIRFKFFNLDRLTIFFLVEIFLSIFISSSVFVIYALGSLYPNLSLYFILLYSATIGFLIGFEIPLMLLILEEKKNNLVKNSSLILFADYFGSLIGFVLFTHIFLHTFGLPLSALIVSSFNLILALGVSILFYSKMIKRKLIYILLLLSTGIILVLFLKSDAIIDWSEKNLFRDDIIISKQTPYQQVVLTQGSREFSKIYDTIRQEKGRVSEEYKGEFGDLRVEEYKSISKSPDIRLFINGGLQFSTLDEFRYHELLVHPAMSIHRNPRTVLIGGGGDGLALREVLKYESIERVFLIDIDSAVTDFFINNKLCKNLNNSSLSHPKVTLVHQDILQFLREASIVFDVVILDFPDPHHDAVAKLYSLQFYRYLKQHLSLESLVVTQSTSPIFHRRAFVTIYKTLNFAFNQTVLPYQVSMPSFGQWGFQMLKMNKTSEELKSSLSKMKLKVETQYLNEDILKGMTSFGKGLFQDSASIKIENWLRPNLVEAYRNP